MRGLVETIKNEWQAKVSLLLFILLTGWWIFIQQQTVGVDLNHNYFSDTYGLIALWGGVWGFYISIGWGGMKSIVGKTIIFFSIGLLLQEFGQLAYSYYYLFEGISVPYPSIGDIGYFGSIPFYILGVYNLAKSSGIVISLKSIENKFQAVLIPLGMLAVSYFLFLRGYEFDFSQPLTIFLDFGYPLGQSIYISLALLTFLLSRKLLGGMMKGRILFFLFALVMQYLADFTFLFQANNDSWSAGGLNDYLYLVSYFLMSIALFQMYTALSKFHKAE